MPGWPGLTCVGLAKASLEVSDGSMNPVVSCGFFHAF